MEDYTWSTSESHSNNTETMCDFIANNLYLCFGFKPEVMLVDGSYAEILIENELWAANASGDGDFNSHRVNFVLISQL